MIKRIVTDRKILSVPCELVLPGEDITQIVQDLKDTFEPLKSRGFGLAANQIGYNKAVAYFMFAGKEYILINPKIIVKDLPIAFMEGCFSFSGMQIKTRRFNYIKLINGLEVKEEEYKGLLAIIIQHECDHLVGLTILDKKWRSSN
jgi:peptide deformylase